MTAIEPWVAIGVWDTWETPRTYYLDSMDIVFIEEVNVGVGNDVSGNADHELRQNYPNPVVNTTFIAYTLPQRGTVFLAVRVRLGRIVEVLENRMRNAGEHTIVWQRPSWCSGTYFYTLRVDGIIRAARTMILLQ